MYRGNPLMDWHTVTHDEFTSGDYRVHYPMSDEGWIAYHRGQRIGVFGHPSDAKRACDRHASPRRSLWARIIGWLS